MGTHLPTPDGVTSVVVDVRLGVDAEIYTEMFCGHENLIIATPTVTVQIAIFDPDDAATGAKITDAIVAGAVEFRERVTARA